MGWWITPEHIGCTRFFAHAPVDTATPDQCGGQWKEPMGQLVVAAAADGGVLINNAVAGRESIEGHYALSTSVVHTHKGASGEVRPVYTWDRPLSEEEEHNMLASYVKVELQACANCCVVT